MPPTTRDALLEHGALLFARRGVAGATAKELHDAIGARNESALNYHFGDRRGLIEAIVRVHVEAIDARRAPLVAAIVADGATTDVRALVHALAAPMDDDLRSPLGRAHLRIVEQLNHPSLGYQTPFQVAELRAGSTVARWLVDTLDWLPAPIRTERLAALRTQLIGLFGQRARLIDDAARPRSAGSSALFLANVLDMLVAGLVVEPSADSLARLTRRARAG